MNLKAVGQMFIFWACTLVMLGTSTATAVDVAPPIGGAAPLKGRKYMTLTGTFHSPEEKGKCGLRTFEVFVRGKQWLFTVHEARVKAPHSSLGWEVLNRLFPCRLVFVGSDKLIVPLTSPDMKGKRIKLEGMLYIGNNWFHVRSVEEVSESKGD